MEKIKPFKILDPNQCPLCCGILHYKEIEIYEAPLDEHGVPSSTNQTYYAEPRLVCSKCGKVWDCERKGIGYVIDHHLPKRRMPVKAYNPFYS